MDEYSKNNKKKKLVGLLCMKKIIQSYTQIEQPPKKDLFGASFTVLPRLSQVGTAHK
jgi:hypothetical protein